ncbi:transposase [Corynebacterium yudongzhengii]|uniref:transposase n=1 Tax=Corynebacterium yudongzhengii TaxID=2080740 RepID=UPI0018FFEB25|nr:transposase [Corynebacterium yudongzhengii]
MLSDAQWEMVEELLPRRTGRKGRPFSDPRQMLEAILYRLRAGIARRDLPACFGSWQTVYTWHNRMAKDGHLGRDPSATSYTGRYGRPDRLVGVGGL